jgi:hypothetical protein
MDAQGFQQYIAQELILLRRAVAELDRRLNEAETRPKEIIEEIHKIWYSDSETCPSTGQACNCHKPEPFEA